jgi:ABC-2 type transport system permease protein
MNAFTALVQKDLKLFFTDRRAVMLTIAVPIMIASFFGAIFGGKSGKQERSAVAIQVVDLDQSDVSREILANLGKDKNVNVTTNSEAGARQLVRHGKLPLAVIIPKDFGDQAARSFFGAGKKPVIGILHDPSRSAEVEMVKGYLTQHVMQTVSKQVFTGASGQKYIREAMTQINAITNMLPEDLKSLGDMLGSVDRWMGRTSTNTNAAAGGIGGGGGITMPFTTSEEKMTKPGSAMPAYNGYAHSFAGMGVQFILMAAIDMGVGILLERQRGLWKRLRSAPLSRFVLLGSKATSTTLISMFTMAISFTFAWLVFGVKVEGSMLGFVLCIVAFSLFTASVGLLLAALGMTPGGTRGLAIPVVLLMVMLGGAWVPAFIFPPWLQSATLVMPTRWAIDALDAMTWRGLGLEAVWGAVAVLLGYTVVLGWLAVKRFKWEAE